MNRFLRASGAAVVSVIVLTACQFASPRPAPQAAMPTLSGRPTTQAAEERAGGVLARARAAFASGRLEAAWAAADSVVTDYPGTTSAAPALFLSARIALAQGRRDEAARRAARFAGLFPEGSPEAQRGAALAARAQGGGPESGSRPIVGAILPRSGSPYLERYGDLVLQGVQLALAGVPDSADAPQLLVDDDAGNPANDTALVRDLESRGALAIIGPLLSAGVAAAAAARTDPSVAIVSPTARDTLGGLPNTYTLSGHDVAGAQALGRYAGQMGLASVAVLYPRMAEYTAEAKAFSQALQATGGQVIASVPYDSGATTFGDWIQPIVADSPQAIYVPAPPGDIRQIAPQLRYYGLDTLTTHVLGNDAWTTAGSRRVLTEAGLNGVIATTTLPRNSSAVGWQTFIQRYEARYRRTLNNPYPALGYDAALLVLNAMRGGGNAAAVAERLSETHDLEGATGVLSIVDGRVHRMPFIVKIEGGELQPVETGLQLQPGGNESPWR